MQFSAAVTNETLSHSPYSGQIAIDSQKEEWESQLCPAYSCSPTPHIRCSLCHALKPASGRHNSSTQAPEVNGAQTAREANSSFTCACSFVIFHYFSVMLLGHCNS